MEIIYSRADFIGSSGRRLPKSGSGQNHYSIAGLARICSPFNDFSVADLMGAVGNCLKVQSSRMSSENFCINRLISLGPRAYHRSSIDLAQGEYRRLIRPCLAFPTLPGPMQNANQGKEVGKRGMECFAAPHSFGQVPAAHHLDAKRRTCTPCRRHC